MLNKKGKINGKLVDVTTPEDYYVHRNNYNSSFTAIEVGEMVLPIKTSKNSNEVGYYSEPNSPFAFITPPSPEEMSEYSNKNIIDFGSAANMEEFIEKNKQYLQMEREILTSPNNIYVPNIKESTTPAMVCFKTALGEKKIDPDNYESRFPRYANDKRILEKDDVSLKKLISFCDGFDMKATLIIEDKNENVPNPIGRKISVELTRGDMNE